MSQFIHGIGSYIFLGELGRGPTGVVYLAQDSQVNRVVACKLLTPGPASEVIVRRARFLREARASACLNHMHVAAVYQVGEDCGLPFIVREFVDGADLREMIHTGSVSAMNAARVLGAIAGAVARVHEHGLMHRNLRPENILVAKDGTPKLIGFSRARAFGDLTEPAAPGDSTEQDVQTIQAMLEWVFLERGEAFPASLEAARTWRRESHSPSQADPTSGSASSAAELARLIANGIRG